MTVQNSSKDVGSTRSLTSVKYDPLTTEKSDHDLQANKKATDSPNDDSGIVLKQTMGLHDGIGLILGIIIGSGIFVSPKGVLEYSGSPGMALVVWISCGIMCLVGAVCYAELGTMIPKSGGDYVYIKESFGPLCGFLYLWVSLVIIIPTGNAVIALAFANYVVQPFLETCQDPPEISLTLIAAAVTCFLTWINCVSIKVSTKMQDIFSVAKVGCLVLIIGCGIYHMSIGRVENLAQPFKGTIWSVSSISTAFYQGLFSFSGWNCLNFVTEELKNPYKNLPRAIFISMPLVLVVYVLTNVAYFAVLTPAEILSSNAVAVDFGHRMLGPMAWLMPFMVACATFSSLNGCFFAGSRLFYASAREGHLPRVLALINVKHFTPIPSLMFTCLMSLFMLVTSDIQLLINYVSFSETLFITGSTASLLWLRYKEPKRERPIKVWIVLPILFFITCIFMLVFPVVENPLELGIASAIIVSGIPIYWFCIQRKPSKSTQAFMEKITHMCQILTEGVAEDKED